MTYTATLLATLRNLNYAVTPSQLHEILLSQGISIKKGTVKRVLHRLWRRGQIGRENRGLYFFELKGDKFNHSRGQKGTNRRGINHLKQSEENTNSADKRGQQKGLITDQSLPSIQTQVFFIFFNNKRVLTLKEVYNLVSSSRKGYVNYRTVQSAVYYYKMLGILESKGRGRYRIREEHAKRYLQMRESPKGPSNPLPGTVPLPTLKYTSPMIKGVIVPRDIFERVINHPPRIDPILMIKRPGEKDPARQWQIETEHVKVMLSERTMKATIYIKGPEWKTDLVDLFGGWILIELQGKKWFTEAAINMKELLQFKRLQAQVGNIKVSVDQSIFGDDYDLEFSGEVQDVNTAILAALVGPAKFADEISHLKEGVTQLAQKLEETRMEISLIKHGKGIQELEKKLNELDKRIKKLDEKIEVTAGGIVKLYNILDGKQVITSELEGYA